MINPVNFWKEKVEIHVYEEFNKESEYFVKIVGNFSYQEFLIEGDHIDEFMDRCRFEGADIYVYKLVKSYEQME